MKIHALEYAALFLASILLMPPVSAGIPVLTKSSNKTMSIDVNGLPRLMYERNIALLIGVDDYNDAEKGWQPLKVNRQLDDMEEKLAGIGFDVYRMKDPTALELRKEVPNWMRQAGSNANSRILLFFGGHGYTDNKNIGYIIPADGRRTSDAQFKNYAISEIEVDAWGRISNAKHTLMIFDSCMSGGLFITRSNPDIFRIPPNLNVSSFERINAKSIAFITAANETIKVPEKSRFLPILLKGLSGSADIIADGFVTSAELGEYLFQSLHDDVSYSPRYGGISTPGVSGDMLFAVGTDNTASDVVIEKARDSPDALTPYEIFYFRKTKDRQVVFDALDAASISYQSKSAQLPDRYVSNTVGCHPDQAVDAVKSLATALIRGGVPLKGIDAYDRLASPNHKRWRLEILTNINAEDGPILTESDIAALDKCVDFWRGPANGRFIKN